MRRAFLGVPVITLSLAFAEDVNAARRASPSRRYETVQLAFAADSRGAVDRFLRMRP